MKHFFWLFLFFCTNLFTQDISGFWKSVDEKTGFARCVVAIYEYDGLYYGRIIGTYDDHGHMKDTIYKPIERAPGVIGHPYYAGLDLIWDLKPSGSSYKGKIIDPQKGNIYNSELWIQNGNLIVRGKLLFFGRNQEWLPATDADFPKGFKRPDPSTFVPVIPEVE